MRSKKLEELKVQKAGMNHVNPPIAGRSKKLEQGGFFQGFRWISISLDFESPDDPPVRGVVQLRCVLEIRTVTNSEMAMASLNCLLTYGIIPKPQTG